MKIIGVTGYAQHGKSSIAIILKKLYGYHIAAFADKLKEIALAINPYVEIELHGGMRAWARLDSVVFAEGWENAKKHPDVRRLLQRVGTEGGRNIIADDIWISLLDRTVKGFGPDAKTCVPDVRFPPNEVDYILNNGGEIIRVHNPRITDNGVGLKHASEALIDKIPANYFLSNDGTLEDLEQKVLELQLEAPDYVH